MSYFSVVIPTYNRATLLRLAIRSVLQQTLGDFEIVISNGGSTDNTRDVVMAFDDPRIKYIESERRLSIGDNYQNGLAYARGRYITFLSDDDAYVPLLLERVKTLIEETGAEFVGYPSARFYHDDLFDQQLNIEARTLMVLPFDSSVTVFTSDQAITEILNLHGLTARAPDRNFFCPYLANNVYQRDVFERLKFRKKELFHSVPADLYLAMAVFYVTEKYYCLNEPLHIWSNWAGNATASHDRSANETRKHYERLLGGRILEYTPLKYPLPLNCGVNAMLEASNDFDDTRTINRIDWVSYFVTAFRELSSMKRLRIDIERELAEFNSVLREQDPKLIKAVRSKISGISFQLLETIMQYPRVMRTAKRLAGRGTAKPFTLISGREVGILDVLDGAIYMKEHLLANVCSGPMQTLRTLDE